MTDVSLVAGEMYDWTDDGPERGLARGTAWHALIAAALPVDGDVLVVGPHAASLVQAIADVSARVTLLVRSSQDALALASELPGVEVVAGALDGYVAARATTHDAVVALDGLDRVLSTDSEPRTWRSTLDLAQQLVSDAGTLLVTVPGSFRLSDVLDARPAHLRHGDDEWVPLYSDPSLPRSVREIGDLVPGATVLATYGPWDDPAALVPVPDLPGPGALSAVLAQAVRTTHREWLADPAEAATAAARAGLLRRGRDCWPLWPISGCW